MKAIREGKWVLLDEINLASAETLQRLSGLLEVRYGIVPSLEVFTEFFGSKRLVFDAHVHVSGVVVRMQQKSGSDANNQLL